MATTMTATRASRGSVLTGEIPKGVPKCLDCDRLGIMEECDMGHEHFACPACGEPL